MAVQVLKSRGVPEEHILFLNLIASPEGVKSFSAKFPRLRVVTAFIDQVRHIACTHRMKPLADQHPQGLDEKKYEDSNKSMHMLTFQQLYRSWPGRLWRPFLHHLREPSRRSCVGLCRKRMEGGCRLLSDVCLGIEIGRIEMFNNHHTRPRRTVYRLHRYRPLTGRPRHVQILHRERFRCNRRPHSPPWLLSLIKLVSTFSHHKASGYWRAYRLHQPTRRRRRLRRRGLSQS